MFKHIEELMKAQQGDRNPGHRIGKFLLEHSNSPEYLVSQLEAYLEAAKADLEAEKGVFRQLFRKKDTAARARRIVEAALSGLHEYYACLSDSSLVGEIEASVKVPDTGNDQLDYENVRDQVEKIARQNESKYVE